MPLHVGKDALIFTHIETYMNPLNAYILMYTCLHVLAYRLLYLFTPRNKRAYNVTKVVLNKFRIQSFFSKCFGLG